MRNPLTKAPDTKNENGMNPEFKKILDAAAGISSETPEKQQEYLQGIEKAKAAQAKAAADKDAAMTEEEFTRACDFEAHAKDLKQFFTRKLDDLRHSPRMDETAYDDTVKNVDTIVLGAAEAFREIASKAMRIIVQARAEYLQTLQDADKTLAALDDAANVLQSRYRYRVSKYTDGSETRQEDPNEWRLHTTRYMTGKGYIYACRDPKKERPSVWQVCAWDEYLTEAWRAAERVSE